MNHNLLFIHEEIQDAIHDKKPIVVVETPIIPHCASDIDLLSYAVAIENIIRENHVVPVRIGLHQGKIHVGIERVLLEQLCQQTHINHVNRRDIPYYLTQKLTANPLLSAISFCANLVNLPVLVSGWLCGMHHSAINPQPIIEPLDISSVPITIVCSGAQSILDLPKTISILDAQGVSWIGYQTNEFPAFLNHHSGVPLPYRLDKSQDIAKLMFTQRQLKLVTPLIVANSTEIINPTDQSIPPLFELAHQEQRNGPHSSITLNLLERVSELSTQQTILIYMELIKQNALLGVDIAIHYQKILDSNEFSELNTNFMWPDSSVGRAED